MGQKVHPTSFRLSLNHSWSSIWFSNSRLYAEKLHEDMKIRQLVSKKLKDASVSQIKIERVSSKLVVTVYSSKPGVVIGKKGVDIAKLKSIIQECTSSDVSVNIVEIKKPELNPLLVATSVAQQLEKRVSFRKIVKRVISSAMKMGARGIRINVKGRIGGTDIARMEWYQEGSIPLHTIKAKVAYASARAQTNDGTVGIKAWIYQNDRRTTHLKKRIGNNRDVIPKKN